MQVHLESTLQIKFVYEAYDHRVKLTVTGAGKH